jgi:lysophospholipase-2
MCQDSTLPTTLSPPYIILPISTHTHTIILLHGRNSTAKDFASEFLESETSDHRLLPAVFPHLKWVFPQAPLRHSLHFKEDLYQWFDMSSSTNPQERRDLQVAGLRDSRAQILEIIKEEEKHVPTTRIILGGISQGLATALRTWLSSGVQIGGFVGISGWLPFQDDLLVMVQRVGVRNETPVLIEHCADDGVVLVVNGENVVRDLVFLGLKPVWRKYVEGGHWVNEPQGIDDLVVFLRSIGVSEGEGDGEGK